MAGAQARVNAEFQQQKFVAWHTAMLPYFKNEIPLDEFVEGEKRRSGSQELLMRARALHEHYGGKK
ncbi:MAG: hypothetical protein COA53_06410 [Rhodobacteraceae bacterium]|nr:MAG: hypothetical protein COA53_06410 [Paracoccaceae bacterium]